LAREVSAARCLECHQPLKARLDAGQGWHSSDSVRARTCADCHSEHQGAKFELIYWPGGEAKFDHRQTTCPLEGRHRELTCRQCHRAELFAAADIQSRPPNTDPARTFLGLGRACLACHQDEHQGQVSTECLNCHNYNGWLPPSGFSHDRARYPLTGRHQGVECAKCHRPRAAPPGRPGLIPKRERQGSYSQFNSLSFEECSSCHLDPHQARLGTSCSSCHTTAGFSQIAAGRFDHSRTRFQLTGRHQQAACDRCHPNGDVARPLKYETCRDCHRDVHRGQFAGRPDGGNCESCHATSGFIPAQFGLSEHQQTRFPLTGSHLAIPCDQCHRKLPGADGVHYANFTQSDTNCRACHTDPHRGQLDRWMEKGGCEFCHTTESWRAVSFDHDRTRFRLEGRHAGVSCRGCHAEGDSTGRGSVLAFLYAAEERGAAPVGAPVRLPAPERSAGPAECFWCHQDIHRGQFADSSRAGSTDCARCHHPRNWKELVFDHRRDSRFSLEGGHTRVQCSQCHPAVRDAAGLWIRYRPLGSECSDCHPAGKP
jgi:hypothetical protein